MMICPHCKAEYRDGFNVCADCEVPLVPEYGSNSNALAPHDPIPFPGDPGEDPFCTFWKGDDGRLHAEICALLDENNIPHTTVRRADHLFNINSQPAFQLGVPFSQYEKAERVIQDAFGPLEEETVGSAWNDPATVGGRAFSVSAARKLLLGHKDDSVGEPGESEDNVARSGHSWDPTAWYPEDATRVVWSGEDGSLGEMLAASLSENEIHSRLDERKGQYELYVLPEEERKAREIVRQVIEATPPE
jgi:hypothetical protein